MEDDTYYADDATAVENSSITPHFPAAAAGGGFATAAAAVTELELLLPLCCRRSCESPTELLYCSSYGACATPTCIVDTYYSCPLTGGRVLCIQPPPSIAACMQACITAATAAPAATYAALATCTAAAAVPLLLALLYSSNYCTALLAPHNYCTVLLLLVTATKRSKQEVCLRECARALRA